MGILLGDMLVRYKADVSSMLAGAKEAKASMAEVGKYSEVIGAALIVAAAAAAVGFTAASVKMAGDFEQQTNLLVTSAGEFQKNIDMIRSGVLGLSVNVGTSWRDLAKGMFVIESAGYHGADALKVEKAAAEGAKIENADLSATTDVLTTSMHNYHMHASQAVAVMDSYRATVANGTIRMDDLTASLKNVLPIASAAHVKLADVEGAIAEMSLSGDKGAMAGTHLSQMLTYLLSPSTKATKVLKDIGLTTQEISDEMKVSLPGTIEMITEAVGKKFPPGSAKYLAALSAIVGGNKSMKAMLELSGGSLDEFKKKVDAISPSMKSTAANVDGWSVVQSNFNFKLDAAKNAVDGLMIKVGMALLPVFKNLLDQLTPIITQFGNWIVQSGTLQNVAQTLGTAIGNVATFLMNVITTGAKFASWLQSNQTAMDGFKAILVGVSVVIATLLISAFVTWAIAAWAAAAATLAAIWPILLIGAIVAAVVFGIIQAVRHWGAITTWLSDLWKTVSGWIGDRFSWLGDKVHTVLLAWQIMGDLTGQKFAQFGAFIQSIISAIGDAFSGLGTLISNVWNGIVGAIKDAINFIIGLINGFIGGIDSIGIDIGPVHIHPNIPKIPALATGGYIQSTGLAYLHAGERVMSAAQVSGSGAGGGRQTFIFEFDRVAFAQAMSTTTDQLVRLKLGPAGRAA